MKRAYLLVLSLTLSAPAAAQDQDGRQPRDLGRIDDPSLTEASGLVASRLYPGILWAHNDSGDTPRIFAVDATAHIVARVDIGRAKARDWEDIAAGPGPTPGRTYLFAGDIGDNSERRKNIKIYRFPEPVLSPEYLGGRLAGDPARLSVQYADTITLTYPDGAHNAETLLVDPTTGDLFIVTKGSANSAVYRATAPPPGNSEDVLRRVGSVTLDAIPFGEDNIEGAVGGDVSSDGRFVLLKSYLYLYRWSWDPTQDMPFVGERTSLPYVPEPQGEAVALSTDGTHYYTLSEKSGDRIPRLYVYSLR